MVLACPRGAAILPALKSARLLLRISGCRVAGQPQPSEDGSAGLNRAEPFKSKRSRPSVRFRTYRQLKTAPGKGVGSGMERLLALLCSRAWQGGCMWVAVELWGFIRCSLQGLCNIGRIIWGTDFWHFGRVGFFDFCLTDGIYPHGGASEKRGAASSRTIRLSC